MFDNTVNKNFLGCIKRLFFIFENIKIENLIVQSFQFENIPTYKDVRFK